VPHPKTLFSTALRLPPAAGDADIVRANRHLPANIANTSAIHDHCVTVGAKDLQQAVSRSERARWRLRGGPETVKAIGFALAIIGAFIAFVVAGRHQGSESIGIVFMIAGLVVFAAGCRPAD
jgi:hypothetical protein